MCSSCTDCVLVQSHNALAVHVPALLQKLQFNFLCACVNVTVAYELLRASWYGLSLGTVQVVVLPLDMDTHCDTSELFKR